MSRQTIIGFFLSGLLLLAGLHTSAQQNITRPNVIGPDGMAVNTYTGNLYFSRNDVTIPAPGLDLDITFSYNSYLRNTNCGYGNGWIFPFCVRYEKKANGAVDLIMPDGQKESFRYGSPFSLSSVKNQKSDQQQSNTRRWIAKKAVFSVLSFLNPNDSTLVLTKKNGTTYTFADTTHKLVTEIKDRNGNRIQLDYDDEGHLLSVEHSSGQKLRFEWVGNEMRNIIDENVAGDTRQCMFTYKNGNLSTVTDPEGGVERYYYRNKLLVARTDKNGNTIDISYNSNNAVTKLTSCRSALQFFYNVESFNTVVLSRGSNGDVKTVYTFDEDGNLVNKQGSCCGYNESYVYDANLNVRTRIDANNGSWRHTYDTRGNVLTRTSPEGNRYAFSYEAKYNQVTSVTDPKGHRTENRYDDKGNLLEIRYPLAITERYTYEDNGNIASETNGRGFVTAYTYDDRGYPLTVTNADGGVQQFEYDKRGNLLHYTDELGHVTRYEYDRLNRRKKQINALSGVTEYKYDWKSNLLEVKDPLDNVTKYDYDELDRLIQVTDAMGFVRKIAYDDHGNVIAMTDPNGLTTSFQYDALNRRQSATNANGEETRFAYDGIGNVVETYLPNGNIINNRFDGDYRLTDSEDNIGLIVHRDYDRNSNVVQEVDGNGNNTRYEYDQLDRLTSMYDGLGNQTRFELDKNDNIIKVWDRKGRLTENTYDKLDRHEQVKDALGNITRYEYDPFSNLEKVIDANSNATTYQYDSLNRLTREIYADNSFRAFKLDAVGNVLERTDNKGAITKYDYDNIYRLKSRQYPTYTDEFRYDKGGRMDSAWNDVARLTFAYDAANRLLSETLNGQATVYSYDIPGRTRGLVYPGGRGIIERYDERNRLKEVLDNGNSHARFTYDTGNRLLEKHFPPNNTTATYQYDANNRLTELTHNPGAQLHYAYTYDQEDNRTSAEALHRMASSETFGYDALDRLTAFNKTGRSIKHSYDGVGNRLSTDINNVSTAYKPDEVNAYETIGIFEPVYDANGNLTLGQNHRYGYDTENRLIEVDGGTTATYRYDPLGRRMSKTTATGTTNYFYANDRVIEEQNTSSSITATYIYGTWIDDVLSMEKSGALYFYHINGIGSVAGISDISGQLVERYEYDPYGQVTIFDPLYNTLTTSGIDNPYYFTGRRLDSESSLYHYRARAYDPEHGRFLQRDPLGYVDGLNLYEYAVGNPQMYVDPLGTSNISIPVPKNKPQYQFQQNVSYPSYSDVYRSFPKNNDGLVMGGEDVFKMVGGEVLEYSSNNACALRLSIALNNSGYPIPEDIMVNGTRIRTFKGKNGNNYIISAKEMKMWITYKMGIPGIRERKNFGSKIRGEKGILIMTPHSSREFKATGHVTIYDGNKCLDNCHYDRKDLTHSIELWPLNN